MQWLRIDPPSDNAIMFYTSKRKLLSYFFILKYHLCLIACLKRFPMTSCTGVCNVFTVVVGQPVLMRIHLVMSHEIVKGMVRLGSMHNDPGLLNFVFDLWLFLIFLLVHQVFWVIRLCSSSSLLLPHTPGSLYMLVFSAQALLVHSFMWYLLQIRWLEVFSGPKCRAPTCVGKRLIKTTKHRTRKPASKHHL